jgi:hypothetical protein
MKAYYITIKDDPDQGCHLVWDTTARNARKRVNESDLQYESWIDVLCVRYKAFDGLEGLTARELALKQWQEGWWFDSDEPTFDDYEENTDADFLAWYDKRHKVA